MSHDVVVEMNNWKLLYVLFQSNQIKKQPYNTEVSQILGFFEVCKPIYIRARAVSVRCSIHPLYRPLHVACRIDLNLPGKRIRILSINRSLTDSRSLQSTRRHLSQSSTPRNFVHPLRISTTCKTFRATC